MKLMDRIRPIAEDPEYAQFRELWQQHVDRDAGMYPLAVNQMVMLGLGFRHRVMQAATEHAQDQVRNPATLTEAQATQLMLEAKVGASRAIRKMMPELAEFAEYADGILRKRRAVDAEVQA